MSHNWVQPGRLVKLLLADSVYLEVKPGTKR